MKSGRIDTMERWADALAYFVKHGYTLYQMQYGVNEPQGFHAVFFSKTLPLIEIVTFSRDVADAIVGYNADHRRKS